MLPALLTTLEGPGLPVGPDTLDLDGLVDSRGVRFVGRALKLPSGLYACLAAVDGCLCRVEVRISPAPPDVQRSL
jgi:hypothetical protein